MAARIKRVYFTPQAQKHLANWRDWLKSQNLSDTFVLTYLQDLRQGIENVLMVFPEAGAPMPEWGLGVRRWVYKHISVVYRIEGKHIVILGLFRENLPDFV